LRTYISCTCASRVQKAVKAQAPLATTILTMLSSVGSRVSAQAIVVAIGLICGAHAAGAGSLPPDQFDRSLASMDSARTSEEPFGLLTMALPESPVQEKRTVVEHDIAADMKTVALCRFDRARCPSAAALRFLSNYR